MKPDFFKGIKKAIGRGVVAEVEARADYLEYVIGKLRDVEIGREPYYHGYIEGILPPELYASVREHMLKNKYGGEVQERRQDNPDFVNSRYNLFRSEDAVAQQLRAIFNHPRVKQEILSKFYVDANDELVDALQIHSEFEYTYTKTGRFQNIHTDIPPKHLSFVFYIPEGTVSPDEEEKNATILYDKSLTPQYAAKFRENSVCIFAPHFYSYHGFSSTMDRDVLVMFYVDNEYMDAWRGVVKQMGDEPPFDGVRDAIEAKLKRRPLKEYGADSARISAEKSACQINAPNGRVIKDRASVS